MSLSISAVDVVKLILQFCKENGLNKTMKCMQEETNVALNTVDNMDTFMADILNGLWDKVLQQVTKFKVHPSKLAMLYDQIICELVELRDVDTARIIFKECEPLIYLKNENPDRYSRLGHIINRPYWDAPFCYNDGSSKDSRRADIAAALIHDVITVPPSRLLSLLGQSLKWQRHIGTLPPGSQFDIFTSQAPSRKDEDEKYMKEIDNRIKFGKKSWAECVCFSHDGVYMVTGSVDGFLEIWDYNTCKLNKNLQYQKEDALMMHEEAVLCCVFSRDSEMLASGSKDGTVKVWKVSTGECVRKFPKAHNQAISAVAFSKDSLQLVTASFDGLIRMHGLKSGRALKEFRGHSSFVTCVVYSSDFTKLISTSADGTVKLWDIKSSDCIHTFRLPQKISTGDVSVNNVMLVPKHTDQIVLCNKSPHLYITTLNGTIVQTLNVDQESDGNFCHVCFSPQGKYLYAVSDSGRVHIFSISNNFKVEHVFNSHERDVRGLAHHPQFNLLSTISADGTLLTWRP